MCRQVKFAGLVISSEDVFQMQSSEEGLRQADELVLTYLHSCSWFIGPFYHLVRLFHPDYVKPLLMAPGLFHSKVKEFIITVHKELD